MFAGWRKVDDLEDRTITIWSKDGVPPATPINSPQMPTRLQGLLWGILPIGSSILAMLFLLIPEQDELERTGGGARRRSTVPPALKISSSGGYSRDRGRLLALTIVVVTAVLITMGTLWPIQSASAMAGTSPRSLNGPSGSDSPQAAAQSLMQLISRRNWGAAYASLANKSEFSETEFVRDLTGSYTSLHSYATLDGFDSARLARRFRAKRSSGQSELVERGGNLSGCPQLAGHKERVTVGRLCGPSTGKRRFRRKSFR